MIRKWSKVLRHWVMWRGFVDEECCWWCVRLWLDIRMVHRGMKNGSMVVDNLYMKRGCCTLEDFLFFSLYLFSCVQSKLQLCNSSDSCLLTPLIQTSSTLFRLRYHIILTNIPYTLTHPIQLMYTGSASHPDIS